jgi:hypothetical protein
MFLEAQVKDQFDIKFRDQLVQVHYEDKGKPIKITQSFPLNPAYRVVGSLDGSIGYVAGDATFAPFIPRKLRRNFSAASYNQGTKTSYVDPETATELDAFIDNQEGSPSPYESFKQSTSIEIGKSASHSGIASTSRSKTTPIQDHYEIVSHNASVSFSFKSHFIKVFGFNATVDLNWSTETSIQKEKTHSHNASVTNNVDPYVLNDPDTMFLVHHIDLRNRHYGERIEITAELEKQIAACDLVILNYFRTTMKKTIIGVITYLGLRVDEVTTDGVLVPLSRPGLVYNYQYDTYFISGNTKSADIFFDEVADPTWVATNPLAIELRTTHNKKKFMPHRVCHIVNFVGRHTATSSTETVLETDTYITILTKSDYNGDGKTSKRWNYVAWETVGEDVTVPQNIGRVLSLIEIYPNLVGCVIRNDGVIVCAVTEPLEQGQGTPHEFTNNGKFTLYTKVRILQKWNSSRTKLIDAAFVEFGAIDSTFIKTNTGLVSSILSPDTCIGGTETSITKTLTETYDPDHKQPALIGALTKCIVYHMVALQRRVRTAFRSFQTLSLSTSVQDVPPGQYCWNRFKKEPEPEDVSLCVSTSEEQLTMVVRTLHSDYSWYGICHTRDDKTLQPTDVEDWLEFGFVDAKEGTNQHTYDGTSFLKTGRVKIVVPITEKMKKSKTCSLFIFNGDNSRSLDPILFNPNVSNEIDTTYKPLKDLTNEPSADGFVISTRTIRISSTEYCVECTWTDKTIVMVGKSIKITTTPAGVLRATYDLTETEVDAGKVIISMLGYNLEPGYYMLQLEGAKSMFYSAYPTLSIRNTTNTV